MQDASAGNPGPGGDADDFPIVITTLPSSTPHYKIAYTGFLGLVVVIAMVMPLATIELRRVDAFVPVIQTVMCITDLATATLLFAHYRIKPQRALLALAGGFVSSGLFAFLQTLAFPGAYSPGAVIGDDLNSATWFFIFWHTVFPVAVIVYALWKDTVHWPPRSTSASIGITIACVLTATAGLAWVATKGTGYLPSMYETEVQRGHFFLVEGTYLLLMTTIALGLLFVRRHTILDQWLIVRLLAWWPNFVVTATFSVSRFTLGWYIARVYALLAGSSLLFVLFTETLFLYARLANAIVLLRREQTDRLTIFNTVADGIITFDDQGTIENLNPAAAHMFDYSSAEMVGRNVKTLMAEPYHREQDTHYLDAWRPNLLRGRREITGSRRNGTTIPIELAVSETAVAGRQMFVGAMHDITNRKRSAERQATLMAELNHRVKNALARVAMLAASTGKGSTSVHEYVRSLEGRIQSMAAAHDLLTQSSWQNVGLAPLVRNQLSPYATDSNVTITGEDIMLSAAETQAMAMVLHELVTNAGKYGSLSVSNGQVCVSWETQKLGPVVKLAFEWRELGGPPVASSVRPSYGTSLIRNLIPHELGGTVDLQFEPDGVTCKIEILTDVKQ